MDEPRSDLTNLLDKKVRLETHIYFQYLGNIMEDLFASLPC